MAGRSDPLGLRAAGLVIVLAVHGIGFGGIRYVLDDAGVAESFVSGLLFGTVMTACAAYHRVRERTAVGVDDDRWPSLEHALRTGEPPDDPTLDLPLLDLVERRHGGRLDQPAIAVVVAVSASILLAVAAIDEPRLAVLLPVVAAGGVLLVRAARRVRARIDRLEARLLTRL